MNYTKLYDTFAYSEYGDELDKKSRFGDFKPDWLPDMMWEQLLGPDVNNLRHMKHTYNLAQDFTRYNQADPETKNILLTTAVTHDWGEAIIGDIALPSKTHEDEKREESAYRKIAGELLGRTGETLSDTVWSVLNKSDPERGDMFRAIEYVGYCTTALRAGQVATRLSHGFHKLDIPRQQKEQLVGGLLSMEKAVEINNFPVLTKYIDKYPGIERQLYGA